VRGRRSPTGLKRAFDIVFSVVAVILLSPILLTVALVIALHDGGPVFYRGERAGLGGKRFRILKFRTMVVEADKVGGSSTPDDDSRITAFGRLLRRYKLDELPQLLNVLTGDMSVVGPRPQVPWAVELYSAEEEALLSVRPGITDYASIRFRNEGEILKGSADPDREYLERIAPEKIRLGLLYVHHHSLLVDIRIIFATLVAVVGLDPTRILGVPFSAARAGAAGGEVIS
jgi:lipopolysaccharide/colanic/teichoic acid biosynthesis glycosyltransferase